MGEDPRILTAARSIPAAARSILAPTRSILARVAAASVVAGLVFCLAAAERLGAAASTREALRNATSAPPAAPSWPKYVWPAVVVLGVIAAAVVAYLLHKTVETLRPRWVARQREAGKPVPLDHRQGDAHAVVAFSVAAILLWAVWQALTYALYFDAGFPAAAPVAHVLAVAAAVLALGGAGRAIGDVRLGWDRASVVRLQLLTLGALVAAFFLIPVTAGQVADVLRAWGDGPLSRVAYGIAAAVILGALVRASAKRLLFPTTWSPGRQKGISIAAGALGLVAAVLLVTRVPLDADLGAAALAALVLATAVLSKWASARGVTVDFDKSALERLPGTLGAVPVGILFAGLSSALADTALLTTPASGEDWGLVVATGVTAVVFVAVVAVAHPPLPARVDPVTDREATATDTEATATATAPVEEATDPPPNRDAEKDRNDEKDKKRLVPRIGLVTLGLAALVLTRLAATGGTCGAIASVTLAVGACVLVVLGAGRRGVPEFFAAAGLAVGAAVAVYAEPVEAPRALGALGVALTGLGGVLLTLHLAGTLGARRAPRGFLAQGWLPSRLPVVGLLAVWVAAAWLTVPDTFHQARTVASDRTPQPLEARVHAWLGQRVKTNGGKPRMPMLLVAASGGGSKAAYWTDLVLDCVGSNAAPPKQADECPPPSEEEAADGLARRRLGSLFLTSSVSGGSVGIYHFLRHRPQAESGAPWVADSAGVEVLSPIVGWGFFHDLPAFMVGAELDPARCKEEDADPEQRCRVHADRAVAQEAAVAGFDEGLVPSDDLDVLDAADGPVTVFNAALDGADGRVLISPLTLSPPRIDGCDTPATGEPAPGSVDGHDLLQDGSDVPLVTASLLTARFPVVAPAARLGETPMADDAPRGCTPTPDPLPPAKLRDGGYVENSGVLTIVEILPAIRRAIDTWNPPGRMTKPDVPIVVMSIDDDPRVTGGDPDLGDAPRRALGISSRAGPGYLTRLARDRLESCQYTGVHYERISPAPHVGAQAATGWEISTTARREDLVEALANATTEASTPGARRDVGVRLQRIRDVLDGSGDVSCPARAASGRVAGP